MNRSQVDFAIAGAGPVGMTTALLLANNGYSVALIDPAPAPRALSPGDDYDVRTYALTPATLRVLHLLGADGTLDPARLAPFIGMHVWDARSNGVLRFEAARLGRTSLGTIIEHANLQYALHALVAGTRDIRRLTAAVARVDAGNERWSVILDNGDSVDSALLIACDGANSPLRAMLGIEPVERPFGQAAIICNVETQHPHAAVARQRFLPDGPLAFLPLPDPNACSIVWSTTPERAMAAVNAGDEQFMAQLGSAFDGALGEVRKTSPRVALPLQSLHASAYTAGRAVLLGDAAHVVHPLAGQGLNLGIMDAAALAEVFSRQDELELKFPRASLRRFERRRRGENLVMLKTTTLLNRLFRDDHRLVARARGTGLRIVDQVEPLKSWLMLRAMGDIGDVPAPAAFDRSRPS